LEKKKKKGCIHASFSPEEKKGNIQPHRKKRDGKMKGKEIYYVGAGGFGQKEGRRAYH